MPGIVTPPSSAPALRTARLMLDRIRAEDFEACHSLWSDPVLMRHIGQPSTRHESWTRMLRFAGSWPLLGFGFWAVREPVSGRYMGEVGFQDAHREMTPNLEGIPEAGWLLAGWAQGRGLATEAVAAVMEWGDANLAHPRTICLVDEQNRASLRVAEKAGFCSWRTGRLGKETPLILRRQRPPSPAP